jgi:hypothetical protein
MIVLSDVSLKQRVRPGKLFDGLSILLLDFYISFFEEITNIKYISLTTMILIDRSFNIS